ncbi:hypothetical protein [Pseudomonas californiensis]|uniref:hypothetical protein n=1 Tax=Pseudomonas californiensis TaxID=2829823 RepID=UPI001E62956D|nr:hypothetical protein [Pseudomonas californiensis]
MSKQLVSANLTSYMVKVTWGFLDCVYIVILKRTRSMYTIFIPLNDTASWSETLALLAREVVPQRFPDSPPIGVIQHFLSS